MTATFWTGSSLSFTNGSKTVTVNTGPSLDSVKANSSLTAGNYNEPVEVKSVSGNTITLYNNWPGSTGTTSATIKPSAAAAASAGVAAQQLITDIQSLVSSASATATANSFVKRDSNGRIKAASPSSNDDVVTKGYLGSAATKNVGTVNGSLMEVGAFGLGLATSSADGITDFGLNEQSGFYKSIGGATDAPETPTFNASVLAYPAATGTNFIYQRNVSTRQDIKAWLGCTRPQSNDVAWAELYHSGNTNFNEFGGVAANDWLMEGEIVSSTGFCAFIAHINSPTPVTGSSTTGQFSILNRLTGAVIASGVTSFIASSASSNKLHRLTYTLPTGSYQAGTPLVIATETASSKITVNF